MNSLIRRRKGPLAPEQYELHEDTPAYQFGLNRREFFKALGSGVAVLFTVSRTIGGALAQTMSPPDDEVAAWIHVGKGGKVTVYTGKAEVGQNIRTSLAQIVAEELHVPLAQIHMVMGDTDLTPYDRGTFGSRSIPYMGPQLRVAAATARELLLDMAAESLKADRASLGIVDGLIRYNEKRIALDQVTRGKELLKPIDEHVKVKAPADWTVAGKSHLKADGESFITGRHMYASDMRLPGTRYGKVLRAPSYGADLASVDLSALEGMKDVTVVHDGNFVGVAAPDLFTASRAIGAVKAEWKTTDQPSRAEIFEYIKREARGSGRGTDEAGNASFAMAAADVKQEVVFHVDYIAHAPLEPRAALATWEGDKLTVWTGTQRPFGVQEDLAEVFHIPKEQVRVIVPDTGSGYGGKHTGEAAIEAARLAKQAGAPVSLVWTREEEFTWAYFRPAGVIEVKAGASKAGLLTSWEFHNYNSGGSGIETPYVVANRKIQFHPVDSPLRQGSYRGLAATANHFARESVMNDLALALGMDPLAFRLKNLKDERLINVLKAAAEKFGWRTWRATSGRGVGIACGEEKGSYVATCAEIAVDSDERVKVVRVAAAFECGAIVNPEHLKNQIQGAVIQGMGGALFEYIDFEKGKILNPQFSRYRVPRFSDVPDVLDVVMLDRKDIPSAGAGETPIMSIAPAIRNAIVNAGGEKLYTLPLMGEEE